MIEFFYIRIYIFPHLNVFSKANRPLSRAVRDQIALVLLQAASTWTPLPAADGAFPLTGPGTI